jgi:hypothetical protein
LITKPHFNQKFLRFRPAVNFHHCGRFASILWLICMAAILSDRSATILGRKEKMCTMLHPEGERTLTAGKPPIQKNSK